MSDFNKERPEHCKQEYDDNLSPGFKHCHMWENTPTLAYCLNKVKDPTLIPCPHVREEYKDGQTPST